MSSIQTLADQLQGYIISYNAGTMLDLPFITVYEPLMQQLLSLTQSYIDEGEDLVSSMGVDYWATTAVKLTPAQVASMTNGTLVDPSTVLPANSGAALLTPLSAHFNADMWTSPADPTFHSSYIPEGTQGSGSGSYTGPAAFQPAVPSSTWSAWHLNATANSPVINATVITASASKTYDGSGTWKVTPGDTLGAIANICHTTIAAICSLNGITNPGLIYAGTTLKIPGSSTTTTATTTAAVTPAPSTTPTAAFTTPAATSWTGVDLTVPAVAYNTEAVERIGSGRSLYTEESKNTFVLPGYTPAKLQLLLPIDTDNPQGDKLTFEFIIGPQGISESHASDIQQIKTGGGWMLYHTGPGLTQLTLSGYFLDTERIDERRRFMELYYKGYLVDKRRAFGDYFNNNKLSIEAEGVRYDGVLTSLVLNKSSQQMFTFSYQMSFVCVSQQQLKPLIAPDSISSGGVITVNTMPYTLSLGGNVLSISAATFNVLTKWYPNTPLSSMGNTPYDIANIKKIISIYR